VEGGGGVRGDEERGAGRGVSEGKGRKKVKRGEGKRRGENVGKMGREEKGEKRG